MINLKEYMVNQPILNIGMIGHVANGKSSIVKKLTGKTTQAFSTEKERNITIQLGYANAKIYKCNLCTAPKCYISTPSNIYEINCKYCDSKMELIIHVSFVDSPGHHLLTSTMLSGTSVMDYTILVESITNPTIPSSQTVEHLIATNMVGLENGIVCLNKIDLVPNRKKITKTIEELKSFITDYNINNNIIPISPIFDINIDILCEYICNLEIKNNNIDKNPILICIRSFDINKPNLIKNSNNIKGGVIGGSLLQGNLNVGDDIIIYPGYIKKEQKHSINIKNNNKEYHDWKYYPIKTKILSINSEDIKLNSIIPGGLVGIQLDIDPSLTRNNKLVGNMIFSNNTENNFKVCDKLKITIDTVFQNLNENKELKLYKGYTIKLNIYSNETKGFIIKYSKSDNYISIILDKPVIVNKNKTKVIISDCQTNKILAICSILDIRICNII